MTAFLYSGPGSNLPRPVTRPIPPTVALPTIALPTITLPILTLSVLTLPRPSTPVLRSVADASDMLLRLARVALAPLGTCGRRPYTGRRILRTEPVRSPFVTGIRLLLLGYPAYTLLLRSAYTSRLSYRSVLYIPTYNTGSTTLVLKPRYRARSYIYAPSALYRSYIGAPPL